ncbi:hypothetical protein RYX36_023049 [Vicia faba]
MVGVAIGAFVIYCLIPKDGGKILPTSPDTTLAELFKQHLPLSVEIQMPPSPPQLTSPNDLVEEPLQHPSPDNDSVEELPQLSSPPTLPTPSMPVPWCLPRVGGQYPPIGWFVGVNLGLREQENSYSPVAEPCGWALGNVAGEDEELRTVLLIQGALIPIARMMLRNRRSTVRIAAWAFSNLIKISNWLDKVSSARGK